MKFKREDLYEYCLGRVGSTDSIGDGFEGVVVNDIVDQRRWTTTHEVVFKYLGKYYQSFYDVGSTEQQDQGPWEYDADENDLVDCHEVEPYTETVTKYRKLT